MNNIPTPIPRAYDRIADQWHDARTSLPEKDQVLFDHFLELLPQGSSVLDLGCGSGIPMAQQLSRRGFNLICVDESPRMLDYARTNVPEAEFHCADITEFTIKTPLGGVVLWDSLFHLPRGQHATVLRNIHSCLCPQGVVLVSSGGSIAEIPPFVDSMFGETFFYDAWPVETFRGLCRSEGFIEVRMEMVNRPDGGRNKGRIGMILQKA